MSRETWRVKVGCFKLGEDEKRNLKKQISLGYVNEERFTRRFEELWAEAVGVSHCIATNSGTSAVWLALKSLQQVEHLPTPLVMTTPLTYSATINAILVSGSKVRWVDVSSIALTPPKSSVGISSSDVFVPVHLLGFPSILRLGKAKFIVEDCCEAHGTLSEGKHVGSTSKVGVFSFYSGHTLGAGEMGALVTEDDELAETARILKDNGRLARRMEEPFRFSGLPGMNLKTTEFSAAIACGQIEKRFETYDKRKRIYDFLYDELSTRCPNLGLIKRAEGTVPMAFPIILSSKASRIRLIRHLCKKRVETRNIFGLMSQIYNHEPARLYPTCAELARSGIYVGCHQHMTEADAKYVVGSIKDFLGAENEQ